MTMTQAPAGPAAQPGRQRAAQPAREAEAQRARAPAAQPAREAEAPRRRVSRVLRAPVSLVAAGPAPGKLGLAQPVDPRAPVKAARVVVRRARSPRPARAA